MPDIKGALSSSEFQKKPFHCLHSAQRIFSLPRKIKIKGNFEISPKEMVYYPLIDEKS